MTNKIEIPNENLRSVMLSNKRSTTATLQKAESDSLCDRCYLCNHCHIRDDLREAGVSGDRPSVLPVTATITSCGYFIPPLFFVDKEGLDVSGCNTFRLGKAWPERVALGRRVALIHRPTMSLIRVARVSKMVVNDRDVIVRNHSHLNHTFINKGYSKRKAAEEMQALLPKLFGPLLVREAKAITAIYFS